MTDDLRYDAALAAALVVLEIFDSSPGAPKPELLKQTTVVIIEAINEYERRAKAHPHSPEPSRN